MPRRKEEEFWNKILLVPKEGDTVRFKYGKVTWNVLIATTINGRYWIKLMRTRKGRYGFAIYSFFKEVYQDTPEYKKLRIVKPSEEG